MGNYVIGLGNYVIVNRPPAGNFVMVNTHSPTDPGKELKKCHQDA